MYCKVYFFSCQTKTLPHQANLGTRQTSETAEATPNYKLSYVTSGLKELPANICIMYMFPSTETRGEFDFDFVRSLKVKCDGVIGLHIYSNICPNSAPSQDISLQNLNDVDLARPLKVKSGGAVRLLIYNFQLVFNRSIIQLLYKAEHFKMCLHISF